MNVKVKEHNIFFTEGQDRYRMVFPTPVEEEYFEGQYILKESYDTEDLLTFFKVHKNGNNDICLKQNSTLEDEEYTIDIDEKGIRLGYATEVGLFRAFTSLRQLIDFGEQKEVPFTKIHDKPQFKIRLFTLYRSRNLFKPEFVCKIVDYLAGLKYNEIQLFMDTPDCFKYDAFPELESHVDCMTPEDIHMLDAYCKERFIDLVPNTNTFGHLRAWLDLEEFKHLEVTDGITKTSSINILDQEAFEFVDKMLGSMLPHFSCDRANIGLDEAFGLGRFQLEEICKEKGKAQVFMDWLNKLTELCLNKYGKRIMFCTDMLYDYPECFEQVPEGAIAEEWGYEDANAQLLAERCMVLQEQGIPYYVTPCTGTWAAIAGRFTTGVNNMRTYGEVGQKYGAYGYDLTCWNGDAYAWELVPLAVGAQYAWNVGIKQHCGWKKPYFVHNAQDYVDRYVFGAKVARDICKLADVYLMEPESVACGTIMYQMYQLPLAQMVKKDFYDITEIYEEYHLDNIIHAVTKVYEKLSQVEFDDFCKREVLAGCQTILLGAEYIRVKITGQVSREKAHEMAAISQWIIKERKQLKKEMGFIDTSDRFSENMAKRQEELEAFIVD